MFIITKTLVKCVSNFLYKNQNSQKTSQSYEYFPIGTVCFKL